MELKRNKNSNDNFIAGITPQINGHLYRLGNDRWSKKLLECILPEREKEEATKDLNTNYKEWNDI